MLSLRIDECRDFVLAIDGSLQLTEPLETIRQNSITAMSAQLGEMIYAVNKGVPTAETVWDKYAPGLFEAWARKTLLAVEGVRDVLEFTQKKEGDVLSYSALLKTDFGDTRIESILRGNA